MIRNYIGHRFGRLTVLKRADDDVSPGGAHLPMYVVRCDCGKVTVKRGSCLSTGKTNSCGCWGEESRSINHFVHGMVGTPTYKSWESMRHRCRNPNHHAYKHYGGRGIRVCERWHSFAAFYDDMGERPAGTSIDRINNDGNYEPGNCRWATRKEQIANRRPRS